MPCLRGFELYSRWVPLNGANHNINIPMHSRDIYDRNVALIFNKPFNNQ